VAQVVGPSLGGLLVQLLSAPVAILVDTASFLFAAGMLRSIRDPGAPPRPAGRRSLLSDVREGMAALLGQPVLRAITIATTLSNVSVSVIVPVLFLFLVRDLHLSPTVIGFAVGVNGVGGILGAILGARA
jgi:predicted MFS family arabinose efflux permease